MIGIFQEIHAKTIWLRRKCYSCLKIVTELNSSLLKTVLSSAEMLLRQVTS